MPPVRGCLPRNGRRLDLTKRCLYRRGAEMQQIKDIMTPQAEVISPDATAEDAAAIMKNLDIGVLPVCDEAGLVGVLTDRDLVVRVLAAKRDPKATLVGE